MKSVPDWLEHSVDAMFAIDGNQQVTFWNQACENLTGISTAEAVGSTCHDILHGQEPSGRPFCKPNCPLGHLARGGPSPSSFTLRISTGKKQRIQINVGTMLIPSAVAPEWMVVHYMRRGHCKPSAELSARHDAVRHVGSDDPLQDIAGRPSHGLSLLTDRERDILCLLADGLATDAISRHLHISMVTVRNHIQRLMAKLNVHTRIEAVTCAYRHHLVRTGPETGSASTSGSSDLQATLQRLPIAR